MYYTWQFFISTCCTISHIDMQQVERAPPARVLLSAGSMFLCLLAYGAVVPRAWRNCELVSSAYNSDTLINTIQDSPDVEPEFSPKQWRLAVLDSCLTLCSKRQRLECHICKYRDMARRIHVGKKSNQLICISSVSKNWEAIRSSTQSFPTPLG